MHLAELGSNVLEFGSISGRTGIPKYRQLAEKGLRKVHEVNPQAFMGSSVDRMTGRAMGEPITIAAPADSYYE